MKYVIVLAMVFLYTMACAILLSLVLGRKVGTWDSCMKQDSSANAASETL